MLELKEVSVTYDPHTRFKKEALVDVNLQIGENERVAIVGRIGSGKSTLIEVLNGLLIPTKGEVIIDEFNITKEKIKRREIVKKISVVFQHPEMQFFAETVFEEVAYGARNIGIGEDKIKDAVVKALFDVGLDDSYLQKSPFELSGGEKRRVAIASIIVMNPKYLILDEPTSNLDFSGKSSIISYLKERISKDRTLIFVTHDMDEAFLLSKRVIAINEGRIFFDGATSQFFNNTELVESIGLELPFLVKVKKYLSRCFPDCEDFEDFDSIVQYLLRKRSVYNG
ncbi:ATP-binding cassette domain-containing protein [Caldisericum exile]|uniref:Cobalt ABC transporter ATP-binding protein n=1 Tax=Caldisericum exile (strain DSM 21853 / NBRC 104410 / AZM16c01) TaxID=511051 RepID=A0A7U6GF91_CALEA|nr:ATP-binding cassette domain-containing protein [Caldisericum exile]BAL81237.1 putative cobalt ABC transporter ATP-binding protein [Caldisericum exile AZM16c01]